MTDGSTTDGWADEPDDDAAGLPVVPGYEVLAVLGRGGMGIVYKARQLAADRLVALKVVRGGALAGPAERARFRAEAEAAARLRHPHVVAVHEVGARHGVPFLAMELVEGDSLDRRLAAGPLPPREAAELVRVVAGAVQHAHDARVVHRDIKPANILLGPAGPKLTDFGLAKRLDSDSTALTRDGAVLGTAGYLPPEQAAGRRDVGPAADVYALGAVLYEALTGRPPFRAGSWGATIDLVLRAEPEPPALVNPAVPRDLEVVCLKCLEKDPARRYASADELAADLARVLAGGPPLAAPVPESERLSRAAAAAGFALLAEVGRGPHAVVYRATPAAGGPPVAVKVYERGAVPRERWQMWFDGAAARWAAATHPHLLLPTRRGWLGDRPFVAQEFVPAGSVAAQFGGTRCSLVAALRLVVQLTEVVGYLHRQGLVHGNVKPSNVLLAAGDIPRLADPLLPGELLHGDADAYRAPELADPAAEPRPHTDVYGLAAVLYALLTGGPPGTARLAEVRDDVPPELDWVCGRCLKADPWTRPPRAYDLLRGLRPLLKAAEAAADAARRPRHRPSG
ncbi:protein kinase [bacterium]|nr:protein kinase [bacterium]